MTEVEDTCTVTTHFNHYTVTLPHFWLFLRTICLWLKKLYARRRRDQKRTSFVLQCCYESEQSCKRRNQYHHARHILQRMPGLESPTKCWSMHSMIDMTISQGFDRVLWGNGSIIVKGSWSTTMQCVRLFTFLLRCGPEAVIFFASKMGGNYWRK